MSCTFEVAVFVKKHYQHLRLDTPAVIKLLSTSLIFHCKLRFC